MFSSRSFTRTSLTFKSLIYVSLIFCVWYKGQISFFCMRIANFSTPFVEETVFPSQCVLGTLVEGQLYMHGFIFMLSILFQWPIFLYLSRQHTVFLLLQLCNIFEIRKYEASRFVLLSQDCSGYFMSLVVSYEFQNCFLCLYRNVIVILIVIILNLYIALDSMNILIALSLPIHEHKMSFHPFVVHQYFVVFNI